MRDYAKLSLEDICIGLKKDHIWKVSCLRLDREAVALALIPITTDFFLTRNFLTNIGSLHMKYVSNIQN